MFSAACILKLVERRRILLFGARGAAGSLVWIQGCEPRTLCQLAQQPWQEVSLQTWWSHSYRKHTSPPPAQHTHMFLPCRKLKNDMSWFRLHHWAHHRQNSSQQFSSECHLRQKTELGPDLSRRDECSHTHICTRIILCRCTGVWDLQHNSPPGLAQHATLWEFINFSQSTGRLLGNTGWFFS